MKLIQRYKGHSLSDRQIHSLAEQFDMHFVAIELMAMRGFDSYQSIESFLSCDRQLYDPMLLCNMSAVVQRMMTAGKTKETVVIYGDYDADGVCSAAILYDCCVQLGCETIVHIPSRYGYGYGLKIESIQELISKHSPTLFVSCDCGITSVVEVDYIKSQGIDVVITDHHTPLDVLPDCTIINPKQPNCQYSDKNLCGSGIALKISQALGFGEKHIDLACVATVADMVELVDENRLIVAKGLRSINGNLKSANASNTGINIGLYQLVRQMGIDCMNSQAISFKVAPCLNVAGRMGNADEALQLLISKDSVQALEIATRLTQYNSVRKERVQQCHNRVSQCLQSRELSDRYVCVIDNTIETGLAGILAARLSREYRRPTFVLSGYKEGVYKATARSIEHIDIHALLSSVRHLLVEFGGHSQAAGFVIHEDNIAQFEVDVGLLLSKVPDQYYLDSSYYDIAIDWRLIDRYLVQSCEHMQPFGVGNEQPRFLLEVGKVQMDTIKHRHTKIKINDNLQLIRFFCNDYMQLQDSQQKQLLVSLQLNSYNNSVQGIIEDYYGDLHIDNDIAKASWVYFNTYQSDNIPVYATIPASDMSSVANCVHGCLVVCMDRDGWHTARNYISVLQHSFVYCNNNNYTKVVVAPCMNSVKWRMYSKIVFVDKPFDSTIAYINSVTSAEIFVLAAATNNCSVAQGIKRKRAKVSLTASSYTTDNQRGITPHVLASCVCSDSSCAAEHSVQIPQNICMFEIDMSREALIVGYRAIVQFGGRQHRDLYCAAHLAKELCNISMAQFVLCFAIFCQLGIVTVQSNQPLLYAINSIKASLNQSRIYNTYIELCPPKDNKAIDNDN